MSKSKEFDNILDECLDRLMFNGETLEQCLYRYPEYADELKPLLEAVLITSRLSSLEPGPEFRDRARVQFYSAIRETESKRDRSFFRFGWQPRWATVVAVVLVLFLATGGTAAASGGSMPDEFLYPVKRATEQVQFAFTFTNLGKAEFHARMADRRVEEIIYLANESKTDKIELLASNLNTNLMEIAELLSDQDTAALTAESEAEMQSGKAVVVTEEAYLEEGLDTGEPVLAARTPKVEEELLPEEKVSGVTVTPRKATALEKTEVDDETAGSLSPEATTAPNKIAAAETAPVPASQAKRIGVTQTRGDRRSRLNNTVVNQANENIPRLRALLEIVPESARPAIQRAIDISEDGYEKAIESLD